MHIGSAPTTGPVNVSGSPHELFTVGGVGTTCAAVIQPTVDPSFAGSTNVGAAIVYVYTHDVFVPEQSVKVQVYVFVPEHAGLAPTTGPVGVAGSPHELVTTGGVGTACASTIHGTLEPSFAGTVNVGALIM